MTEEKLIDFLNEYDPDIYFEDNGNVYMSLYHFQLDSFTELLDLTFYDEGVTLPAQIHFDQITIDMNDICDHYRIDIEVLKRNK